MVLFGNKLNGLPDSCLIQASLRQPGGAPSLQPSEVRTTGRTLISTIRARRRGALRIPPDSKSRR